MATEASDVALAEFGALRDEILARSETQGKVVAAALTIIAVVGGFALAKKEGRIEMLLVLPITLSGLGMLLVQSIRANLRISLYIRECLWPQLPPYKRSQFNSWEDFVEAYRQEQQKRLSTHMVLGTLPGLLIFVVPSVAALVLTREDLDSELWPLWWGGVSALVLFGCVALTLLAVPKPPPAKGKNPA